MSRPSRKLKKLGTFDHLTCLAIAVGEPPLGDVTMVRGTTVERRDGVRLSQGIRFPATVRYVLGASAVISNVLGFPTLVPLCQLRAVS